MAMSKITAPKNREFAVATSFIGTKERVLVFHTHHSLIEWMLTENVSKPDRFRFLRIVEHAVLVVACGLSPVSAWTHLSDHLERGFLRVNALALNLDHVQKPEVLDIAGEIARDQEARYAHDCLVLAELISFETEPQRELVQYWPQIVVQAIYDANIESIADIPFASSNLAAIIHAANHANNSTWAPPVKNEGCVAMRAKTHVPVSGLPSDVWPVQAELETLTQHNVNAVLHKAGTLALWGQQRSNGKHILSRRTYDRQTSAGVFKPIPDYLLPNLA